MRDAELARKLKRSVSSVRSRWYDNTSIRFIQTPNRWTSSELRLLVTAKSVASCELTIVVAVQPHEYGDRAARKNPYGACPNDYHSIRALLPRLLLWKENLSKPLHE